MADQRQRVQSMRDYIDARVRRQTYIFGAVAGSLLIIWLNMIPLHQGATEAAGKAREYLRSAKANEKNRDAFRKLAESKASQRETLQALEETRGTGTVLSPEQMAALSELRKLQLKAAESTLEYKHAMTRRVIVSSEAGSKYDKLLAALDAIKVPFKISEFELPLSYRYAALAWQWFAVAGVAYVFYSRRKILCFHAQIVRASPPVAASHLNPSNGLPPEAPFWLAPLPAKGSTHVTRAELHEQLRLGWRQTVAVALCWIVILWFYYYAASTQAAIITMRSARGGFDLVLSMLWAGATAAMLCLLIAWFWPFRVEAEASSAARLIHSASRRTLLSCCLTVAIAVPAAMVAVSAAVLPWSPRQPRFRKVKRFTRATWPSAFYLNPKSRVLHYLDANRRIRALTNRGKMHLVPYSFASESATQAPPRVNAATFSYAYEAEALRHVAAKDDKRAIELLFRAVNQDMIVKAQGRKYSMHLYDLLAGLIVRSGSADEMQRLRQLLQAGRRRVEFAERLAKWEDATSAWHRRWSSKRHVRWNRLVF